MPEPGTPEARRLFERLGRGQQAMTDAGVLIECFLLQPAMCIHDRPGTGR